jgi:transcriptional regulator with XRE-family HTH domain
MLTEGTVRWIEELLADGALSQRQIARVVGVDRETVGHIASGKRPDYAAAQEARAEHLRKVDPPQRCGKCGKLSKLQPCFPCWLEAITSFALQEEANAENQAEALGIDLRGKQRQRYIQILETKIRAGVRPVSNLMQLHRTAFEKGIPMVAFDRKTYIRWFLGNLDHLFPLVNVLDKLQEATTVREKWEILKWSGEIIVDVIGKVPTRAELRANSMASLEREAEAQGIDWQLLLDALPLIVRIIRLIEESGRADEWEPSISKV